MKRFFVKNIYRLLLNRIYNPFIETNLKPLELNLTPEDKCLVIAPHPDDESIGCGGIMKLHPKNFDVTCLTHGNINDIRFEEMQHAMEFAGVNSYKMLNLKDKNIIAGQSEFNTIDISQYDYIFIPYIFDQHRDHKAVSLLLANKLQKSRYKSTLQIAYYEVWSTINLSQYYVNISNVIEDKKKMINFHKSQIATRNYAEKILGLNSYRGLLRGLEAVECFSIMNAADFTRIVKRLTTGITE